MHRLTGGTLSNADVLKKLTLAINSLPSHTIKEKLIEIDGNSHRKEELLKDRLVRYNKRVLGFSDVAWHEILDVDRVRPKDIESYIKSLDPQAIVSELERFQCNISGGLKILQDRFTRFC